MILEVCSISLDNIDKIVQMISWVSSSKNGDNILEECNGKEYLLIPRYADRLEALGIIGLERTLNYTLHKGNPLFIVTTPNPRITIEEIYTSKVTHTRYESYSGTSVNMIYHFYDKLLRFGNYPIQNSYFDEECMTRQKPLEYIALLFESTVSITKEQIQEYIKMFS